MSQHHCHAKNCTIPTKPEMLMCFKHWKLVPQPLQRRVWAEYRQGQCNDKKPSERWFHAAHEAIEAVFKIEQRRKQNEPNK